jgi:hypothetical protein
MIAINVADGEIIKNVADGEKIEKCPKSDKNR